MTGRHHRCRKKAILSGRFCRLEPLDLCHADDLFAANAQDIDGRSWTYMPYGSFESVVAYRSRALIQLWF